MKQRRPLVQVVAHKFKCDGPGIKGYQINLPGGSSYIYGCACCHARPTLFDVAKYADYNVREFDGEDIDPMLIYLEEQTYDNCNQELTAATARPGGARAMGNTLERRRVIFKR